MFNNGINLGNFLLGEDNIQRAQVLAKVLLVLGPRDGDEITSLSQDPSEAELAGSAPLLGRNCSTNQLK